MWTLLLSLAAAAAPITLKASDGQALGAEQWGKGTHGVLLIHGEGGSSTEWAGVGPRLAGLGLQVVAIDLRGHGRSALGHPLAEADYPAMSQDVTAGITWLRAHGATAVSIVGANLGASIALQVAAKDPAIRDVALLSAKPSDHGFLVRESVATYDRPLLVAASLNEALAAKTAQLLGELAQGPKHVALLDASGSGAKLLNTDSEFENTLVGWLQGTLIAEAGGAASAPAPQLGSIETTGKRLEAR